jgi:hypothetical protein
MGDFFGHIFPNGKWAKVVVTARQGCLRRPFEQPSRIQKHKRTHGFRCAVWDVSNSFVLIAD